MRTLLAPVLMLAAPAAAAQSVEDIYLSWQPTAPYVIAGQDEPGYRNWYMASARNSASVTSFHNYLQTYGVSGVVPTWQLLRTASDWQRCGADPFEVPPTSEWPNLVWTLRYVRDQVVPTVGPVEVVSGYRNPTLNQCAGGARESVHQHFSALDLVPLRPTTRDDLIRRLCTVHAATGPTYAVGLGFYTKLRFHVDSWRFRTWGRNDHGGIACPASYALSHQPNSPAAQPATSAAPAEQTPAQGAAGAVSPERGSPSD